MSEQKPKPDQEKILPESIISRGLKKAKKNNEQIDSENKNIVIENDEGLVDEQKIWITVKEASDKLGMAEKKVWQIIDGQKWKIKKIEDGLNQPTFVLRSDVEQYCVAIAEQQKSRLPQLEESAKRTPISSDESISDTAAHALPAFIELQQQKKELVGKVLFWKRLTILLILLIICASAAMALLLLDTQERLVNNEVNINLLNGNIASLRQNIKMAQDDYQVINADLIAAKNNLETTKNDLDSVQKELKTAKDNLKATKADLVNARTELITIKNSLKAVQKTSNVKQSWIDKLEQSMSKKKLKRIKEKWQQDKN